MPLLQRALVRALSGPFFLIAAVASQAATDTGVYVEIRESDLPDAPVVERWKLYGASHALVIGIDNYSAGWPRLSNAVKDARLVAQALEVRGFEVTLLTNVTGSGHSSAAAITPDKTENFCCLRSEIFGPYLEKHFRDRDLLRLRLLSREGV